MVNDAPMASKEVTSAKTVTSAEAMVVIAATNHATIAIRKATAWVMEEIV